MAFGSPPNGCARIHIRRRRGRLKAGRKQDESVTGDEETVADAQVEGGGCSMYVLCTYYIIYTDCAMSIIYRLRWLLQHCARGVYISGVYTRAGRVTRDYLKISSDNGPSAKTDRCPVPIYIAEKRPVKTFSPPNTTARWRPFNLLADRCQ